MSAARHRTIVVDSEAELLAYLEAFSITTSDETNSPASAAQVIGGVDAIGEPVRLTVDRAIPDARSRFGVPSVSALDEMMVRAVAFSAENPPHHPGTIARFPMPSERFRDAVELPLAVLAVDGGKRGIYAPPRVAVMDQRTAEPRGVGDFPDFSPDAWPPPRLGDWPPASLGNVSPESIAASVARLSGCLMRLLDHQLGITSFRVESDVEDARELIRRLEVPGMYASYRRLSPHFFNVLGL